MPTPGISPARQLIAAIDDLMALAASFYFQPGQPLRALNKEERKHLLQLEGRVVGLVAIVAQGRIPLEGCPANCRNPSRYTVATGLPFTISNLGMTPTRNSAWEAKMLSLRGAVQAVIDTEETSGQKDKKPDTVGKRKNRPLMNLKELVDLKKAMARGETRGQTMEESAVEFTNGDEQKAQALLRSLRRNRHRPELS
jgi:hypothetical protein